MHVWVQPEPFEPQFAHTRKHATKRCVTHDVTAEAGSALRLLSPKQRPPHSCPISPAFSHDSLLLSSITKPDCVLVIPLEDKEPLSLGTRPSISLLSPPPALEAFSVNGHPLPVLTHHKPASPQPTQSSRAPPVSLARSAFICRLFWCTKASGST